MNGIFVSYRRQDSQSAAGRLADDLKERLPEAPLFRDVETIAPGVDFVDEINRALASCGALLAVIGPRWLTQAGADGKRRLDDPGDFIRLEISTALKRDGVRVIPVLVEGAVMPSAADLPDDLKALARRNAIELTDQRWRYDVGGLETTLRQALGLAAQMPAEHTPQTAPRSQKAAPSGNWWTTLPGLLTGAAGVITAITGLVVVFGTNNEPVPSNPPAAQVQPAPTPTTPPAAVVPAISTPTPPRLVMAGAKEVSFDEYRPSTYTVLGLETTHRTPTHYGLRVKVRLLTRTSMDMNFWDSAFRLLIDGLPSAPISDLNLLVPGNAALDGEVTFEVPYAAQALVLRVIHHDSLGEVADLPLRVDASAQPTAAVQSVRTGEIGAGAGVNIQRKQ